MTRITWANVLHYSGGKFGHMVSENYLAFARIALWFYQNIGEAKVVKVVTIPTNLPQTKWNKPHNVEWLKLRGLEHSGLAKEVSERVVAAMLEDPVPAILPQPSRPVKHVFDLVGSLTELLQCLMAPVVTKKLIMRTRLAVQVFLSKYDQLDMDIPAGQKKKTSRRTTLSAPA